MKVELHIPLKAKLKEGIEHPALNKDEWANVDHISMGQSYTMVVLTNGRCFNSVDLDFYIKDKQVDIFNSFLFNPYITLDKILDGAPGICFGEERY